MVQKQKRIISIVFFALTVAFAFLALFFNLCEYNYEKINGFQVIVKKWEEIPGEPKTIDNRYPEYDRHGTSAGHAFTVKYAKNFRVENCEIVLEKPDVRPEIAYFEYEE